MKTEEIKDKLITAGVKNLVDFGYPYVNKDNILTDIIYAGFFRQMLVDNKGNGYAIDNAINELLQTLPKLD